MRAVVTVEHEASGEVPELVDHPDGLVRADPDDVVEAVDLAGRRLPAADLADAEAAEVDVDRVPPAPGVVDEDPFLVAVEDRKGVDARRVPLPAVDRPLAALPVEPKHPPHGRGCRVGRVLGPTERGRDAARVGLVAADVE